MHFGFTAEQRDLADLARQVAAELSVLAESTSGRSDLSVDARALVETGLTGLLVSEEQGGFGATVVEAGILAEALGHALVPAVVAGSFLIAPAALALIEEPAVRDEVAVGILEGRAVSVGVAADLSWPPSGPSLAWAWQADAAVLMPGEGGLLPTKATSAGRPTADLTMLVADAVAPKSAGDLAASPAGQRFIAVTNCLTSCLLLGHMRSMLERTVSYAKEREQFGAKIGSFQAIKHLCADMFVDIESAHSIAYGAAAMVSAATDASAAETGAATRVAAAAKAWCGDAAIRVGESAIQVHGGIGFTWEVPLHRYLRAAHLQRASFMSPPAALDLITRLELDRWT